LAINFETRERKEASVVNNNIQHKKRKVYEHPDYSLEHYKDWYTEKQDPDQV